MVLQRNRPFPPPRGAGLQRERNIAEQFGRAIRGEREQFVPLQHRERQHIGRLVLAAPFAVQRVDFGIVGEQQAGGQARVGEFGGDLGERLSPASSRSCQSVAANQRESISISSEGMVRG